MGQDWVEGRRTSTRTRPAKGVSHWCEGRTLHGERCANVVRDDSDHCEAGHYNRPKTPLAVASGEHEHPPVTDEGMSVEDIAFPAMLKLDKQIIEEIERNGPINGPELAKRLKVPQEILSRSIWCLLDSGRIELDRNSKFDLVLVEDTDRGNGSKGQEDGRASSGEAPECASCGMPMSPNPHVDAGDPVLVTEIGAEWECIPCLVAGRHNAVKRYQEAERDRADLAEALRIAVQSLASIASSADSDRDYGVETLETLDSALETLDSLGVTITSTYSRSANEIAEMILARKRSGDA